MRSTGRLTGVLIGGGVTLLPALPIAGAVLVAGARRGAAPGRIVALLALVGYLALLAGLVFFPLPVGGAACAAPLDIQPVPFLTIGAAIAGGAASHVGRIGIGNVAAFVPLGLLVPLLLPDRPTLRAGFFAGLVGSLAVELGQLGISAAIGCGYRAADVDDVILNALGGLLGAVGAIAILRLMGRRAFRVPGA